MAMNKPPPKTDYSKRPLSNKKRKGKGGMKHRMNDMMHRSGVGEGGGSYGKTY